MSYRKEIIVNELNGESYVKVKHPSGLTILIWKKEGFTTTEALFSTKYGSVNNRFKQKDDTDFVEVPEGIAHFLEHKLFENEDCDVFELYAKTGAMGNAYTSFEETTYLFSCSENYAESLRILLSFVQKPYFTEQSVAKEQGIIGQEIKMGLDNPDRKSFFNLLDCLYVNHPVKIDIAGTAESIARITPELLYKCYNAFYNLHNMCLAIAGNLDVDEVLKICDEELIPAVDYQLDASVIDEPQCVAQSESVEQFPVGIPLFNIGYKCKPCEGYELLKREYAASILLQLVAGNTSKLYNDLTDEGLINSTFDFEVFWGTGHFNVILSGESSEPRTVRRRIDEEIERLKKAGLDRNEFEVIKKSKYGSIIKSYDNIDTCASYLLNSHFAGVDVFDLQKALAEVTFEDVQNGLYEFFNKDMSAISIIEPTSQNKEGECNA